LIFVTVGNVRRPFVRLVEAADRAAALGDEEFFVQSGHTPYQTRCARQVAFLSLPEYDRLVAQARLVIAHAGSGSIIAAFRYGKPIIVMPRQKRYGEHVNDHQLEIAGQFARQGLLRRVDTFEELCAALQAPLLCVAGANTRRPPLLAVLEDWVANWTASRAVAAGRT
jgi:UDP-N-acetylglucosamine transferase subunit ALG13